MKTLLYNLTRYSALFRKAKKTLSLKVDYPLTRHWKITVWKWYISIETYCTYFIKDGLKSAVKFNPTCKVCMILLRNVRHRGHCGGFTDNIFTDTFSCWSLQCKLRRQWSWKAGKQSATLNLTHSSSVVHFEPYCSRVWVKVSCSSLLFSLV